MKSLSILMLAAALVTGAGFTQAATKAPAASKATETEDRHLSGFSSIEASGSFDVEITQGNTESVKVEAPAEVINRIETVVENGVLRLSIKRGNWNWSWNNNNKMVVYVNARSLNSVTLGGSGDVSFKNGIKASKLRLAVVGSGGMHGHVDVQELESKLTGSGEMKLSGRASVSTVSVTGSGDYAAESVTTDDTSIRVSGSGSAHVNANVTINAVLTGSGDIYYSGNARQVHTEKHGSGDINRG